MNEITSWELAKRNGLHEFLKAESESGIYFDSVIQYALDKYIGGVYDVCKMKECEKEIMEEINTTIKEQPQGRFRLPISRLSSATWPSTGLHSHTMNNLPLASYYRFKPSIMCRELHLNELEWASISEREYLPVPNMLMEACKMGRFVTHRWR